MQNASADSQYVLHNLAGASKLSLAAREAFSFSGRMSQSDQAGIHQCEHAMCIYSLSSRELLCKLTYSWIGCCHIAALLGALRPLRSLGYVQSDLEASVGIMERHFLGV